MCKLSGVWAGWTITDQALISPTGRKYKPSDIEPEVYTQSDLAKALGVTRGAIADRVRRGTLPPFDEGKTWRRETIQHLFK
ncbi:MAG: hypothetical protein C6P35_03420 [Cohnella sp.]|uniref:DUF3653 domain-containing protein n=1 Tax=Cohnella sp. TaxID=1883426 RepID=UPI000E395B74|nr:MAG: hypothetical protein C6P35_03420 [Cohnella sp.]